MCEAMTLPAIEALADLPGNLSEGWLKRATRLPARTRRPDNQSIPFEPTDLFPFNKETL